MSNIWCEKHWNPYSTGGLNGLLASLLLQQEALDSEVFMRRCGWDPETGAKAETERLNQEIEKIKNEFGGLCCFLGDEVMERILTKIKSKGKIESPRYCKDCKWWELLEEDPEVGGHGNCHHLIAQANYQLWWNQHPEFHKGLNPPNSEGGFRMEGCHRSCEVGEIKG